MRYIELEESVKNRDFLLDREMVWGITASDFYYLRNQSLEKRIENRMELEKRRENWLADTESGGRLLTDT